MAEHTFKENCQVFPINNTYLCVYINDIDIGPGMVVSLGWFGIAMMIKFDRFSYNYLDYLVVRS